MAVILIEMLPTSKETKQTSEHSNDASETTFDASNFLFTELPSSSAVYSEVAAQRPILESENSIEAVFQQTREWLQAEDEQSAHDLIGNSVNFDDDQDHTFELFAVENIHEDLEKPLEFELRVEPFQSSKQVVSMSNDPVSQNVAQSEQASDTLKKQSTQEPKSRKKAGRKRINTGLTQRKDVVLKKVLRKIRNFYLKDFKACTQFLIKTRGKVDDAMFKDHLQVYIQKEFNQDPKSGMVRTLSNLMFAKDNKQNANLIYQTLYKFSFARFSKITKNVHFKYLIQRYSEKVETETLTADESIGLAMIVSMTVKP